ncbi:MAG: pre-peptidase C-terminal domain-containing protein [Cyanobacteriota bacterium]
MIDDLLVTDSSNLLFSSFNPYTTNIGGSLEPPDLITPDSALNSPLGLGISPEILDLEERASYIGNNSIAYYSVGQSYSPNINDTTPLNASSVDALTGQVLEGSTQEGNIQFEFSQNLSSTLAIEPSDTSAGSGILSSSNDSLMIPDPDGTLETALHQGTFNDGIFTLSDSVGYNADPNDFFQFSIDKRSNLNLRLNGLSADANLRLIKDHNGNKQIDSNELIAVSELGNTVVDSVSQILETGDYYVQVLPGMGAIPTNYNLEFQFVKLTGDIWNQGLAQFGGVSVDDEDRYYPNGVNIYHYGSSGRTSLGLESSKETIVVIHGWLSNSEADNIKDLLTASASQYPEHQVLAIDWGEMVNGRSIAQDDRDVMIPFHTARSITPVATWAKETLEKLGVNSQQISLFGHSLGSYVSAEIGRLFGGVKTLVALDPAWPGSNYDLNGNQPDNQRVLDFKDVADRSLAFVVKDAVTHLGGLAGDANKANKAHDSFVIKYDGEYISPHGYSPIFNVDKYVRERAEAEHGAVIDVFRDALSKGYLKLEDNLLLPSDHRDDWYGKSGNWAVGGTHEGRITANRSGSINYLSYVYDVGRFNLPKEKQTWNWA